jgi:hypothetical protein
MKIIESSNAKLILREGFNFYGVYLIEDRSSLVKLLSIFLFVFLLFNFMRILPTNTPESIYIFGLVPSVYMLLFANISITASVINKFGIIGMAYIISAVGIIIFIVSNAEAIMYIFRLQKNIEYEFALVLMIMSASILCLPIGFLFVFPDLFYKKKTYIFDKELDELIILYKNKKYLSFQLSDIVEIQSSTIKPDIEHPPFRHIYIMFKSGEKLELNPGHSSPKTQQKIYFLIQDFLIPKNSELYKLI